MIQGDVTRRSYPLYYEDAAHIAYFLTQQGLRLKARPSTYMLLMFVSCELELSVQPHSDAGRRIVRMLSDEPMEEARRKRLEAIAGTLYGNFLTSRRIAQSGHK